MGFCVCSLILKIGFPAGGLTGGGGLGGSCLAIMKKPLDLNKLKVALRKIASVPKAEVDRRIAEERKLRRASRSS